MIILIHQFFFLSGLFDDPPENSIECRSTNITFNDRVFFSKFSKGSYNLKTTDYKIKAMDSNNTELFCTDTLTLIVNENVSEAPHIEATGLISLISPNVIKKFNENKAFHYYSADFEGISNATFTGTGDVLFSLSVSPEKMDIHDQSVYLHGINQENGLKGAVKLTENNLENKLELTLSGKVDGATISDVNMFPSFFGWFRDNIYLAPLSLVSIVFASVSLLHKQNPK